MTGGRATTVRAKSAIARDVPGGPRAPRAQRAGRADRRAADPRGKLGGFHFNDSQFGDDDLDAGSIKPFQLFLVFDELVAAELEQDVPRAPGLHARSVAQRDRSPGVADDERLCGGRAFVQAHLIDRQTLAAAQDRQRSAPSPCERCSGPSGPTSIRFSAWRGTCRRRDRSRRRLPRQRLSRPCRARTARRGHPIGGNRVSSYQRPATSDQLPTPVHERRRTSDQRRATNYLEANRDPLVAGSW